MKRITVRIFAVLAVAYAVVVGFLAFYETELVYLGYARADARRAPSDTALPWDSVRVMAADSTPVYLLVSEVDRLRRPWAIYFHGNAASVFGRGNVARYRLLRDAGYNVVAVEYRGFGASAAFGPPSERGLNADATAAWTWLTDSLGVPPDWIIVYGWSLGSGPAVMLASTQGPAALVTEGAFASLPRVASMRYRGVPAGLIMRNRFDNLARAPSVTVPWLIFHGRPDDDVPFDHALLLAEAAPRDRLFPLDADHNEGVLSNRADAVLRIEQLVTIPTAWARYGPPHEWDMADRMTKRLPPESFPQLPAAVRADLRRRGCTVPQEPSDTQPHNVISGSFIARGTTDWAVLCSIDRKSRVLVYRDGATAQVDDMAAVADKGFLQGGGNGTIAFSRRISPIRGSLMISYHREFGGDGPPPPRIDHLGIEDAFVGKVSAVIYFYRGKWLTLTGAD